MPTRFMDQGDIGLTPTMMLRQQHQSSPFYQMATTDTFPGQLAAPPAAAPPAAAPSGMPPLPPSLAQPPAPSSPAPATPAPGATPAPAPAPGSTATTPPPLSYDQAFNNFKDFIGYDFAFDEAMRALSHQYASGGAYLSGAAGKAFQDRAAQIATQMAAFPYLNYLGGQQAMGAQAGSALAGVGSNFGSTAAGMGQNYANSASAINAGMGGAIQGGANALSNAAIANGVANANLWSGVGSALGTLGSSFINPGP